MKIINRAKFWENPIECCGTCSHVFPTDALVKPGYQATCLINETPIKNARKERCDKYNRRNRND